jgi:hypothetical protein
MQRKSSVKILAIGCLSFLLPFIVKFPSVEIFLLFGLILISIGLFGIIRGSIAQESQPGEQIKTAGKLKANWKFVIGVIIGVSILAKIISPSSQTQTATRQQSPKQQYAKKDGTFDERKDDLDELCQDYVFYKAKIYKYAHEGNEKKTQEARVKFKEINYYLSQYSDSDVAKVCSQYDTRENAVKYMR